MDNKKFNNNKEREEFLDQKFEELQEIQEADLLMDFDKAIEEDQKKPYTIKFLKKYYEVPRQMPFDFATFFFRYCYKKINGKIVVDVPEERIFQFIQLMFGNEMIRALESNKKKRVSVDMVFDKLAMTILEKWGYGVSKKGNNAEKKI